MDELTPMRQLVRRIVNETPVLDMHTHIYPPTFGPLLLWGVDELLTYHYLVAEVYRVAPLPYERFWAMSKTEQADHIWKHLFIERSPISEACRGVLTVLQALGLDTARQRDLTAARQYFNSTTAEKYVDTVFAKAKVKAAVMTNDPFDDLERPAWLERRGFDGRFQAVLRIDPLLRGWEKAVPRLREWGYNVRGDLSPTDVDAVKRFLLDWIGRMRPRYMAVSLPPSFVFPEDSPRAKIIEHCIMSVGREAGLPFAMMIGARLGVNPDLRLAGDGTGRADVASVDALCQQFPQNRFFVTMLSRENQHELCVSTRKHPNLMLFGCWWFLNNPTFIRDMTSQRMEMLGLSFVPQHSDARVLDQLIYKWAHSREIIADVLAEKYADLARTGWPVNEAEIRRDVNNLLAENFDKFAAGA